MKTQSMTESSEQKTETSLEIFLKNDLLQESSFYKFIVRV
jgi:hypothetical protein